MSRERVPGKGARTTSFLFGEDTYCVISVPLDSDALCLLTEAELAVARLIVRGLSNRAIATTRGTSERTVANQMAAILRKLGASSRTEVVARLCGPSAPEAARPLTAPRTRKKARSRAR